ncbi:MAG: hypothetical protein QOJ64_1570, partial [Acidobacteriota bacterium]|nr:hypothetical protein [Acidobacteriota bacterium]
MAKRSPNYPSLTLEQAYEKVRKVYDEEHTHAAPREVVALALGYTSLNGASLSVIGTLVAYGLLEKVGTGNLKVSADTVSILELDEGHPKRQEALDRLAFTPKLFAELKETFGASPPSDINLKHFLIQDKAFLPKAAMDVIRVYRANLELVTEQTESYDSGAGNLPKGAPPPMPEPQPQNTQIIPPIQAPNSSKGVHEFSFPLSFQRDVKAVITIYGDKLQRRDLEFLKRKVGDLLEGFDEEPELET